MPITDEDDIMSLLDRMPLQPSSPVKDHKVDVLSPSHALPPSANAYAHQKIKRNVRFSEQPPIFYSPPKLEIKPPTPLKKRRESHDHDPDSPLPVVVEQYSSSDTRSSRSRAATPAYALDDAIKVECEDVALSAKYADDSGYGELSSKAEEEEVQQLLSPSTSSATNFTNPPMSGLVFGNRASLHSPDGPSFTSPGREQHHSAQQIFPSSNQPTYFGDSIWKDRSTTLRSPIKLQSDNKRSRAEYEVYSSPRRTDERAFKVPKIEVEVASPTLSQRRRWYVLSVPLRIIVNAAVRQIQIRATRRVTIPVPDKCKKDKASA